MKGLELSKKYFEEFGRKMLHENFCETEKYLAIGLIGSGSECYGFDDEISQDHDFEPGFCIFLPDTDTVDRKTEFLLEKAYNTLPNEFYGFKRAKIKPVGGNRHGVIRISDFVNDKTGTTDGNLQKKDWFFIPEQSLFELTDGEVFCDNYGLITSIRKKLNYFPEDIRLKKLAGNILLSAQAGQYNYNRLIKHNETAAAQLAIIDFTKSAMQTVFLLNKKYMPYYKWSFRALKELPVLSKLYDSFDFLLTTDNRGNNSRLKNNIINDISGIIANELENQKIIDKAENELENIAYNVNNKIKDADIRNLNIFYGV